MRLLRYPTVLSLLALLLFPMLTFSQDEPPQKGYIDFGFRKVWGDVYGRPDLAFKPDPLTSKFNEYSDRRTGIFVRKLDMQYDDIFGSKKYVALQSQSSFYKNQSYLATFGEYGKFKLQFRYDEIPHIYTNTAVSLYTQTAPGVLTMPLAVKTALQTASSTGTASAIALALPSFITSQLGCGPPIPPSTVPPTCSQSLVTPRILRKMGAGTLKYYATPNWVITALYGRENQIGSRPIGLIFNSSPSTTASGQPGTTTGRQSPGTGVELPEPIDYFNNTVRAMSEYGKKNWVIQFGYTGSFFENNIDAFVFDNPFATADIPVQIIAPGGGCIPTAPALNCTIGATPSRGRMDLYPSNRAQYLNFAGAFHFGERVTLMGTVNPGWLHQNDAFLPYTINTGITGLTPLPSNSLDGKKQTLAMNWTLVAEPMKNIQLAAKYRQYDYNNNTEERIFTPVQGDTIGADSTATVQAIPVPRESKPFGYNKKTLELAGNWYFGKRSSWKAGYEGEWFDREHRDVSHSMEHSFFTTVDYSPVKDLLFRVAYRHQDRKPEEYQDEEASFNGVDIPCSDITTVGFTSDQRCARRFDETARILNRAEVTLQYNANKFTFTGGFQTIQSDMNRPGRANSAAPLNFLTGAAATTAPYYLYGAMKDLGYVFSFDGTYTFTPDVSFFAEYTHERYYKRMISRYRVPTSGVQTILTCSGCDTANNDWESTYNDIFHTYAAGLDTYFAKKVYFTAFYSLSAGIGNVVSRFLGDSTILAPATTNRFLLVGSAAALNYPQTTTRIHELAVVLKYKINKNVMPKFEYRLQQFDNQDYQTTPMSPYMGCISPATGTAVTGCPTRILNSTTSPTPILSPNGATPFYPGFQVGDTSAVRYIFLGVDQPSNRVHTFSATLEIRF